eukprot:TRINITY_DN462_c0_g1_i1.p1 TRINITY_DN462_c0_g1~~TRINITY_DN462_c0_g1_i1.p1  ORF type:complete len:173 (-),score=14.89 TRINITY_DN462_c0_g1_i1:124-642(-)
MTHLLVRAYRSYNRAVETHGLVTKTATAAVLMSLGDFVAQFIEREPNQPFDWQRHARLVGVATVFVGPFLHYYYLFLEKRFPSSGGFPNALKKLAVDQLIVAPVNLAVMMTVIGALENPDPNYVKNKLSQVYLPTLKVSRLYQSKIMILTWFKAELYHLATCELNQFWTSPL